MSSRLQAILWVRPRLRILNQLLLPHRSEYSEINDCRAGHHAIASMQTRGAPAIAIVAALSLAAELCGLEFSSAAAAQAHIRQQLAYLSTSRPTAVNLFDAVRRLNKVVDAATADGADVCAAYVQAAEAMLAADIADNQAIGTHGARYIAETAGASSIKLLTHCNTGALATAGHGTALGIARTLHELNVLSHVYFTETRPYNQGARLTAFELLEERIPSTLVCDSAVSALLQSDPGIQAIVVGADRVAANGDTANKIGTYQLAITAHHHNRLFIVAAPSTSIDLDMPSGKQIEIEQRDPSEILVQSGFTQSSVATGSLEPASVQVAPLETRAWNPSFDVTPAALISAIVTEKGVITKQPNSSEFDIKAALS
ncbi:S-methyl-5-thioribose-1-phosphate isomerase [Coemansia sp. RSA 2708]|nr:S-methyl-5-thioribose-1-phosphate isomerase [Coemansia sp. RSA 2708]